VRVAATEMMVAAVVAAVIAIAVAVEVVRMIESTKNMPTYGTEGIAAKDIVRAVMDADVSSKATEAAEVVAETARKSAENFTFQVALEKKAVKK